MLKKSIYLILILTFSFSLMAKFSSNLTLNAGLTDNIRLEESNKKNDTYVNYKIGSSFFGKHHEIHTDINISRFDKTDELNKENFYGKYLYIIEENETIGKTVGVDLFLTNYQSDGSQSSDESFDNRGISLFYDSFHYHEKNEELGISPSLTYVNYTKISRDDIDLKLLIDKTLNIIYLFSDLLSRKSSQSYFSCYSMTLGGGLRRKFTSKLSSKITVSYGHKVFSNRTLASTSTYFTTKRGKQSSNPQSSEDETHQVVTLNAGLNYKITPSFKINLKYNYVKVNSNNELAEYSENNISSSVSYKF